MNMPMSYGGYQDGSENTHPGGRGGSHGGGGDPFLILSAVGSLLGFVFATVSTYDFMAHLDRRLHDIHCSFIPGAGATMGESGCKAVMMSPYSALFRETWWGGLPISALAMAVFGYLVARTLRFILDKNRSRDDMMFLLVATVLPVAMSILYGVIAATRVGRLCTLCVGIYVSSAVAFVGAALALTSERGRESSRPTGKYAMWFLEGVGFVAAVIAAYLIFTPTQTKAAEGCGALPQPTDTAGVLIPLGKGRGPSTIAVLDPLCAACKAFDARMIASGLYDDLSIQALLFPLDSKCNWMVAGSMHPGACALSEAMLCDKEGASAVLDWSFQHQEELLALGKENDAELRRRIETQFPRVKGCLGSATITNKLNKSLRFAVANALPVLTPQLIVEGTRVCDEDVDLGLEYTVANLVKRAGGARAAAPSASAPKGR